jgi:hypothetical protein
MRKVRIIELTMWTRQSNRTVHAPERLAVEHARRMIRVDDADDDEVIEREVGLDAAVEDAGELVLGQHVLRVRVDLEPGDERAEAEREGEHGREHPAGAAGRERRDGVREGHRERLAHGRVPDSVGRVRPEGPPAGREAAGI